MKYPKLVPEAVCKTPCEVVLFAEGITEDGAHKTAFSGSLKCLFQSSSKRVKTDKDEEVTLSGEAFFASDFCPELPEIPAGLTLPVRCILMRCFHLNKASAPYACWRKECIWTKTAG